jgi:hypothetical protein
MNVKLLRKVKDHILAEPLRLYMPSFHYQGSDKEVEFFDGPSGESLGKRPLAKCGTAACIGGWVCALSGEAHFSSERATELLEIDDQMAGNLFFSNPEGFDGIWTGDGTLETAKLTAARIEHFIKTKGRE